MVTAAGTGRSRTQDSSRMFVCSRNPAHRNLGQLYCQEPNCHANVRFVPDPLPASAPDTSTAATRDPTLLRTVEGVASPAFQQLPPPFIGFRPLEFGAAPDEELTGHTTPPRPVPPPPPTPPIPPLTRDLRKPKPWAMWVAIVAAMIVVALVARAWFFRSSTTPAPRPRSSEASVAAAKLPPDANEPAVALPQSVPATPYRPATTAAVSNPGSARNGLLGLQARAVSRAQAAASLYASANQVLRRPEASAIAGQAKAAFAGVRAATARIAADAAAAERADPDQRGALLRDAADADRTADTQSRRLHAAVARARALTASSVSRPPSNVASMPVETRPWVPERTLPPAPVTADDRHRYAAAVRSYRSADACYRDLTDDLSRAYGDRREDAARNQGLRRRVRALYDQLRSLASAREALAGASPNGPARMLQFERQIGDYVDRCVELQRVLGDSRG
jgi:hypothetical protein